MGTLHDDIDSVPDAVWRRTVAGSVYETKEWLSLPRWPGDGAGYLQAADTMVPARIVTDPGAWPSMNLVNICAGVGFDLPVGDGELARARRSLVPHLIVAAPGFHTVPIGARDRAALVGLVDAVAAESAARALPAGFAHLPPEADGLLQVLRERGYRDGVAYANARLDLPGSGFADFLRLFRRDRRNTIRNERARFAAAGGTVQVLRGAEVAPWSAAVAELEAELNARHGFTTEATYFEEQNGDYARRFGDRMYLIRADLGGRPVGSMIVFAGPHDVVMRSAGLQGSDAVRSAYAYFEICYQVVELAYRLGVRRIMQGPRAWRAKTLRGARLVPLRVALAPDVPAAARELLTRTDATVRGILAEYAAPPPARDGTERPGTDPTPAPDPAAAPAGQR